MHFSLVLQTRINSLRWAAEWIKFTMHYFATASHYVLIALDGWINVLHPHNGVCFWEIAHGNKWSRRNSIALCQWRICNVSVPISIVVASTIFNNFNSLRIFMSVISSRVHFQLDKFSQLTPGDYEVLFWLLHKYLWITSGINLNW